MEKSQLLLDALGFLASSTRLSVSSSSCTARFLQSLLVLAIRLLALMKSGRRLSELLSWTLSRNCWILSRDSMSIIALVEGVAAFPLLLVVAVAAVSLVVE